jgi:hypothetical protein
MGSGTFDPSAYRAYAATTAGKATHEIYSSRSIHKNLDPKGVKMRESRDSADNPNSTPIIVAIDVTGSMGIIADVLAREGLGTLFRELLDRKPVTDPHLMFMAIGDANFDEAPLQVSQFEADNRIVEQLTQIFLEKGGGGNNFESYNLAWYFAANHTVHDSLLKRGKRGYLFTVGDEEAPALILPGQILLHIGDRMERLQDSYDMLMDAQRMYDVFHIVIAEGSHARSHPERVRKSWSEMLGQHVIWLADHNKLAETIVSTIEVVEGRDAAAVTKKFGVTVFEAVKHLPRSKTPRLALTN